MMKKKKAYCRGCGQEWEKPPGLHLYCPACQKIRDHWPEIEAENKRAADEAFAIIWKRGQPLDGLPSGLKQRIEQAINYGY